VISGRSLAAGSSLAGLIFISMCHVASAQTLTGVESVITIQKIVQTYQGKTICSDHATVRDGVNALSEYSKAHPEKHGQLTDKDLYDGLVEAYPCPFNPKTVAARPAKSDDIAGFWGLSQTSQRLSPKMFKMDLFPAKCQYFGFYPDGDFQTVSIITQEDCPSVAKSDFTSTRKLPRTINWEIGTNGEVRINHTDIYSVEVWEAYVVTEPSTLFLTQPETIFTPGDLLMYLSQYNKDKKQGVGTLYFRHLKRLLD